MSESEKTNELDSYGVWVKTPPKTVDSSDESSTETSSDTFNIDTDLPDFSELDVIDESVNEAGAYDNDDTALSAEELSAIAVATADQENADSAEPSDEEQILSGEEEEISLDEFITDGIFETGPDEDKIREKEAEKSSQQAEEPTQEESVELSDFGVEDDSSEAPLEETTEQTEEAVTSDDEVIDIDLSFDDESPAPAQAESGFIANPEPPTSAEISADNPAGTEEVDLSEFGLGDFSTDLSSDSSSESSESSSSDDGMESVDLSEFGFDDIDSSENLSSPSEDSPSEKNTETSAEDAEEPVVAEDSVESEEPISTEEDFTVTTDDDTVEVNTDEPTEAESAETTTDSDDIELDVSTDDETVALEADSVTDATPESSYTADGDEDFDVDAILGDVTDENGNTVAIGSQEDSLVREVSDIPSDEAETQVESEEIEDLTQTESFDEALTENTDIPDTFDEEASSLFDSPTPTQEDSGFIAEQTTNDSAFDVEKVVEEPIIQENEESAIYQEQETNNATEFAESIKAPILDEMEDEGEKPSTQMTAIFSQIVGELSSLKTEIASLKNEFQNLKNNNAISSIEPPAAEENSGFFSNTDEDDTIALSTDELDNILNTADITEAPAESVSTDSFETIADEAPVTETEEELDDEIQPDAELPEEGLLGSVENIQDLPDEDFDDNTDLSVDFSDNQLVEPALDEIDYSTNTDTAEGTELPDEISVPKTDDILVESSSSDFMDSVATDSLSTEEEPIDASLAAEDFEEINKAEPTINETLTDEKLDYLSRSPQEQESTESIPKDLTSEIKSVLSYMDQLLENLPEEKIAEFAKSEQFDTYKKLFKELGLA